MIGIKQNFELVTRFDVITYTESDRTETFVFFFFPSFAELTHRILKREE